VRLTPTTMNITFGIDFDHGSWPGPLVGRAAVVGESWVGPGGVLSLLETALGLGGPRESEILRAADLIPIVQDLEGFWSESAEHNPLSAARTLLRWRDELWMCGWRGEPLAPRLEQLAQVTAAASAGFPDRLQAVVQALENRRADIDRIELCDLRDELPPLWKSALAALEERGTLIEEHLPEPAPARGTLQAIRAQPPASLSADGTLQLLRPYGVIAAAEEVAAWLSMHEDLDGSVLIGGSPVLDAALQRHGLPATGAGTARPDSAILEILPLVLEMGWNPPDPQRALELVTLPISPIPRRIASRLAEALGEWPAVGSDLWQQKLEEGLAGLPEDDRRASVSDRIATLFKGTVSRSAEYPATEIRTRVELLRAWFSSRLEAEKAPDSEELPAFPKVGGTFWWAGVEQCSVFLAMVDRAGLAGLPGAQLERFVQAASGSVNVPDPFPSQAGLHAVQRPGAIVGEAKRIVWWSFDLASAPSVQRLPVSAETRQILAQAGIHLPDPGSQALQLADHWRRPLFQASEALLLVCPRHGADGEDLFPHPFWDELAGRHGTDALAALETAQPLFAREPKRARRAYVAPPRPTRAWAASADLLAPRQVESPSSLGDFLGCSLKWALNYHARLRPGRGTTIPGEALVLGKLLHEVVEAVLLEDPASPDRAHARAQEVFDHLAPRLVAWLFLPGSDALLSQTRRNAAESARHLTRLLQDTGLQVKATEEWLTRKGLGAKVGGRLDLLLGDPRAVIDLKLGGATSRREELENGTAHALAIYSYLSQEGSRPFPAVGYFILSDQILLTNDTQRFPSGERVEGPSMQEAWNAVQQAVMEKQRTLAAGKLDAPGNPDTDNEVRPGKTELVDGRLVREAPCRYCDYSSLCGLAFRGEQA